MSHHVPPGATRPTLFCLHFLGGSEREWRSFSSQLEDVVRVVAVDLPGFGAGAGVSGFTVAEMANHVVERIMTEAPKRWMLVGHSMGAKVAMAVARRAEDGAPELSGLEGLVLLGGSPPAPEPMDEAQRQDLLQWFQGDTEQSRLQADSFITQNVGKPLAPELHEQAVQDVLRCSRAAWMAWFDSGSREDWRQRIGVLATPALILSGTEDADLGPPAQQALMVPHFAHARVVALPGAGHLLPLERPLEVARLVREAIVVPRMGLPGLEQFNAGRAAMGHPGEPVRDYAELLASPRVSAVTRAALTERACPDEPRAPETLEEPAFTTLQALVDRVLPQPGPQRIDLAGRIDALLTAAAGDGWRFAVLPPDAEAYRRGLRTINGVARVHHGRGFAALDGERQDDLLRHAAAGTLVGAATTDGACLDPARMKLWFQDVCAEATRLYVSHPATMARLGYSGVAYGGDQPRLSGYRDIGIGRREPWEPVAGAVLTATVVAP